MRKRWFWILLILLIVWLLYSHSSEFNSLKVVFGQANLLWVGLAIACQMLYFVVFAISYQAAFAAVDEKFAIKELIPLVWGSLFFNVVIPAGPTGGTILFSNALEKRQRPASRAVTAVLLQLITDFIAFFFLLIPGMLYLFVRHDLKSYEIVAAIILLFIIAGLSLILAFGLWKPALLMKLLGWLQTRLAKLFALFHKPAPLDENWVRSTAEEYTGASKAAASHPRQIVYAILLGLAAHILDMATLFLLFPAFNQQVTLGALTASYAIGILFWIVAITPQGMGMVEGMLALTLTSLGYQAAVATSIALAFRGISFWLPLLLGFFSVQQLRLKERKTLYLEKFAVHALTILVALMGVINVLSSLTPALHDRLLVLQQYLPLGVMHGGHLSAAVSGFLLLVLAQHLWRRKKAAWWLALILLVVTFFSHLLKGLDYEEAIVSGLLLLGLWLMRRSFHARSDPPSIVSGLRLLAGAFAFTLLYGTLGFFLLDRHYSLNFDFWQAISQTVVMFTQWYNPGLVPLTHFGRYFADSIYWVGILTVGAALLLLLRPVLIRQPADADLRQRARSIIEKYGHSSLCSFLLLPDKSYFFSGSDSLIAYTLVGRTAVTLGDPVGPPEQLEQDIQAFKSFCRTNDWQPVFYQTLEETRPAYLATGFESMQVGEEAIIPL